MVNYLVQASPGRKKGIHKPKVCNPCGRCYRRLDVHVAGAKHRLKGVQAQLFMQTQCGPPRISIQPEETHRDDPGYSGLCIARNVDDDSTATGDESRGKRENEDEEKEEEEEEDDDDDEEEEQEDGVFRMRRAKVMGPAEKRKLGLTTRSCFTYLHQNTEDFLMDFRDWLTMCKLKPAKDAKQIVEDAKNVWSKVDRKMQLGKGALLARKSRLEGRYFAPLYKKMVKQSREKKLQLRASPGSSNITASTIRSRLDNFKAMLSFLTSQDVFIGK